MANIPTKGHVPDKWIDRPFGSGMRFINGDTLLARMTPRLENGKATYVDFLTDGCIGWGSTEYIVMRPKPPIPNEFAYCLARSPDFREFAIHTNKRTPARASESSVSLATSGALDESRPSLPALFAQASATAHASGTLIALREALLPKLMSGEIRLRDTDRLIGEIA